jgi:16S rRNA G966 N2-methylase RsmD
LVGMAAQRYARQKQAILVLQVAFADPPFAVTAYESAVSNAMTRMA